MSESTKTLRPYYDSETFNGGYPAVYRPGIGVVDEHGNTIASKISRTSNFKLSVNNGPGIGGFYGSSKKSGLSTRTLRDMAKVSDYNENIKRNMYSDLELSEYFEWNNIGELIRSLVQSFMRNYLRSLIAQPFEVARLLLQIGDFKTQHGLLKKTYDKRRPNSNDNNDKYDNDNDDHDDHDDDDDEEEEEEEEEIDYFQPRSQPENEIIHSRTRTIKKKIPETEPKNEKPNQYLIPVSLNTVDVMSSLMSLEGARGLWRASNVTFIINALSVTLEAWLTGFISPFLQIPDPFFVDVTHSPDPTSTLVLSISASVISSLLLSPLDLIRTRMIITSINGNERSLRNTIKNLKFFTCPISLIIPTVLNTLANNVFKKFTPYILYVKFGIDTYGSPIFYSTVNLISSTLELFLKLPIETLLRRAQVNYLLKKSTDFNQLKISGEDKLIVKFGGYSGIWKTLYDLYYFKGENSGVEAIFRGWRVGLLNIVGSWGLSILQQNYDDQILKEEKF